MKRIPQLFMLLILLLMPAAALADSLVVDNQWYEFSFTTVGIQAQGCYPADPSDSALNCLPSAANNTTLAPEPAWDYNVANDNTYLFVTDAFLYGDAFDVYDNGNLILSTPMVTYTGNGCGDNPVNCLADPNSSSGAVALGLGMNSITIVPTEIGDAGAAYFDIADTPEPSELPVLLLVALCALWTAHRRRILMN